MRKLIMKMSISMDCLASDAHGGNDWMFNSDDKESLAWSVGQIGKAGLIIMGRKSFELMAPYWPTATGPFAAPMNEIPKAVFTRKGYKGIQQGATTTAENPSVASSWTDAQIFSGDLGDDIKKLKEGSGKPILAIGGAEFMQSLIATGLIDEYQLAIHPVALGSGLPIFTGLTKQLCLKLVDVTTFPGGIVVHTYCRT